MSRAPSWPLGSCRDEDDVEAAKLLVVEIECAVVHDVHLDSVKNLDPPHARSDAGDFGGLLWNIGGRQGPGRPGALRMVGDCDLLIAELSSGADHIGNLVLAVAPGTVYGDRRGCPARRSAPVAYCFPPLRFHHHRPVAQAQCKGARGAHRTTVPTRRLSAHRRNRITPVHESEASLVGAPPQLIHVCGRARMPHESSAGLFWRGHACH